MSVQPRLSTEPVPSVSAVAVEELAREGEAARGTTTSTGIPGRERADRIRTALAYTVMLVVAALFAIPFLWSVSTSFRTLVSPPGLGVGTMLQPVPFQCSARVFAS